MSTDSSDATIPPARRIRRRSIWVALTYVIFAYFASQIFAGFIVSIYPSLKHWSNSAASAWLNNSIPAQFFYVLIAESAAIWLIYIYLRYFKIELSFIGWKKPRWLDPLAGAGGAIVYYIFFFVSLALISQFLPEINVNQQQQIGFSNVYGGFGLLLTFVSLVVLPPLAEEIMLRGFLYSSLRTKLRPLWATLIVSGLFAAAHLPEGGAAGPLWIAAVDTFLLSLVLCYLREKTGSLWAGITLHAIKNGVAFASLFLLHLS